MLLEETLNAWPVWPVTERPRVIKTFADGLNHQAFLLAADSRSLVLKLFREPNITAIAAQQWAAKLKLAPKILYTSNKDDYVLMEYIAHPTISAPNLNSGDLSDIAGGLWALHSANYEEIAKTIGKFDLLKFCHRYLAQLDDNIRRPAAHDKFSYINVLSTHQALEPALNFLINEDSTLSLCHNDLVADNCFITETGVSFIDWEYAQIHNPWFDLAAIIAYLQLSDSDAALFLEAYQVGFGVKTNTAIFYTSQIALLWVDILWHLANIDIGFTPQLNKKIATLGKLAANVHITIPKLIASAERE
jgi:thiamine kinase-like enzyme